MKVFEVKPQGYCGGVRQAIQKAIDCRKAYPEQKITVLGNLVHNQYVKKALEQLDIQTVEDSRRTRLELLDDIHEGIVIFTAHGVHPDVRTKAKDKGLIVVDASCPFVVQTQAIVSQKLKEGYDVFYIGKYKHPEAESIYLLSDHVHLIQSEKDICDIASDKIFVTNQTTMSIYEIESLFHAIRVKYPSAQIHDEICNATRVRQQAVRDLDPNQIDALIVVGDPSSNNTRKLASTAWESGIRTVIKVQNVQELNIEDLKGAKKVAVTSGASTPGYLTKQILRFLTDDSHQKEEICIDHIL